MKDEKIIELVKRLEPFFIGYKAEEDRLKNSNGMELRFSISWHNKPTVSGLHASRSHSIGCSFEKSCDKIFKDIRKRLMPDYHDDFFKHKRAKQEREEAAHEKAEKLRALASVSDGEVCKNYGYSYNSGSFVSAQNLSVHEDYNGYYNVSIKLRYMDAMKLVKHLKDSQLVDEKSTD